MWIFQVHETIHILDNLSRNWTAAENETMKSFVPLNNITFLLSQAPASFLNQFDG